MASPYSPVLVKAAGQRGAFGSTLFGGFVFNQQLYCVLIFPIGPSFFAGVFRSTDFGTTWTELDAAHHPTVSAISAVFDGDHTVVLAFRVPGVGLTELHLCNFDLHAGTWSAVYGTGAGVPANCSTVGPMAIRPDGTLVVIYDNAPPTPVPPASNMIAAVFSQANPAGAWVTTFDAGTNMAQEAGWIVLTRIAVTQAGMVCDSSGRCHITFGNSSSGLFAYQSITSLNALGTYHLFTENLQVFSGIPIGPPVIFGGVIVIGAVIHDTTGYGDFATIYRGTPLAAPVFSVLPLPGIESLQSLNTFLNPVNVPRLAVNSGMLAATWSAFDVLGNAYQDVHIGQNRNPADVFTGWTEEMVWSLPVNAPPGFNVPGQRIQLCGLNLGSFLLTIDANDPSNVLIEQAYWMGLFSLGASSLIDARQAAVLPLPDPTKDC